MFGNFKTIRIALALMLTMIVGTIQAQTVSGNVKDSFGDPVIGATIMEKGTQNGTVTDIDGNFTLKLQKAGNITVTYVGMKAQTVETKGKSSLSITMEDDNTTLNDVVVVGYGVMKYNPQNEMFRKNKTTRSALQNEMFLFGVPSQQRKNASDFSGAFLFSPCCFKRSNQTSHSRRHQAAGVSVPGCSRICVRCQGSALCFSEANLSAEP